MVYFGRLDVTEHTLVDRPEKETEKPKAGQQIVHDRCDGEHALGTAPREQNEFAKLVGKAKHAGDQEQSAKPMVVKYLAVWSCGAA